MTLRTSRRRVSSRAKRRYRIIKKFIRKTIGSTSQTVIRTHSNTKLKLSVSDLKHKIFGIEPQLDKISKHCPNLRCIENNPKQQHKQLNYNEDMRNDEERSCDNLKVINTKVLYKATNSKVKKFYESEDISTGYCNENDNVTSTKTNQHRNDTDHRKRICDRRTNNNPEKKASPEYLSRMNRSPDTTFNYPNAKPKPKYFNHKQYAEIMDAKHQFINKNNKNVDKHIPNYVKKKSKLEYSEVNPEFISDIINKQYKPVKLYGRRESEFTQFSAPVCRDREFFINDNVHHSNDLCSCCFEQCKKRDITDMRSVCDTHLYSMKKRNRYSTNNQTINDYNNSAYYDIVPVKENPSPKPRKKNVDYNTNACHSYLEVPPSPRTQRPRLNLRARAYNEYGERTNLKKCSPNHYNSRDEAEDEMLSKTSINGKSERKKLKKPQKPAYLQNKDDIDINFYSKADTNNWSGNNTDKALGEIKDILQTFLTVIKKESIDNANNLNKCNENNLHGYPNTGEFYANTAPNGQPTNINGGQCNPPPFLPFLPNTCCYPIMPVYPVNYLQNGYLFPSASQTFQGCPKTSKDIRKSFSTCNAKHEEMNTSQETRQLIKEIHKYVTHSPKVTRNKGNDSDSTNVAKKFEKKSVGASSTVTGHNTNLGAAAMRYISRSCEAIVSRKDSYTYQTNASYSATIIDRVSMEATPSSQSGVSWKTSSRGAKKNKILKMLTKLWGKKKNDVVEELSESETTIEVDVESKSPPFRQNITNYAMHSQEYYNPPPMHTRRINQSKYPQRRGYSRLDSSKMPTYHKHQGHAQQPYYDPNYCQMPQVPLCLKEIEVKSIATQSERKMSLIRKLTQKAKIEKRKDASQQYNSPPEKNKLGLFNWMNLQEDAKKPISADFTLKTKKQLNQGDNKLRNAMIKKFFYKRNPFSPRNLIVKTLLGKDESSFGNPPKYFKPKLFI